MTNGLHEMALRVITDRPDATKSEWGLALFNEVERVDGDQRADLDSVLEVRRLADLGQYVAGVKAGVAAAEQRKRTRRALAAAPVMTYGGQVLAPTLSVRREDGFGRQLALWVELSPRAFVEAVQAQQRRIDGLSRQNAVRLDLAEKIFVDADLLDLPTLRDVCNHLGVDPDTLGLEELPDAATA